MEKIDVPKLKKLANRLNTKTRAAKQIHKLLEPYMGDTEFSVIQNKDDNDIRISIHKEQLQPQYLRDIQKDFIITYINKDFENGLIVDLETKK